MRRRKSREFALQILFSLENQDEHALSEIQAQAAVNTYLESFAPKNRDEVSDLPYLQRLMAGILSDVNALDQELEKYSEHWKLYRMTKIDRNILRIGAEELKSFKDIPSRVTIDECVELAKRFGTDDSSAFVNGILDKLRTALGRNDE
jgi:N utilization substance protein B